MFATLEDSKVVSLSSGRPCAKVQKESILHLESSRRMQSEPLYGLEILCRFSDILYDAYYHSLRPLGTSANSSDPSSRGKTMLLRRRFSAKRWYILRAIHYRPCNVATGARTSHLQTLTTFAELKVLSAMHHGLMLLSKPAILLEWTHICIPYGQRNIFLWI